jgi:hypothetical protein
MKGLADAIPPAFCWKKGGDVGVIPTECPSGYFRSLALCYQYCRSGYKFVLGVCWEQCPNGYTDIGLLCWKNLFNIKSKGSYMSHGITNFSSSIPCPEGRYRFGALCYKNCANIAMTNCGIGACSRDTASCISAIINMAVDVVNAVLTAVAFIISLGTSSALATAKQAAMGAMKGFAKSILKSMARGIKNLFMGKFKKTMLNRAMKKAQDHIRDSVIQGLSNQVMYTYCKTVHEDAILKMEKDESVEISADTVANSLDFFGIRGIIDSCGKVDEDGGVGCAKGILTGISNFDPTGITVLVSTFIHPACEVPLQPEEPIIPDYVPDVSVSNTGTKEGEVAPPKTPEEKVIIESVIEIKAVAPNCLRLYADCDYKGTHVDICSDQSTIPTLNNQVSSFQTGESAHGLIFADENYFGGMYTFRPSSSERCLSAVMIGDKNADNLFSSVKMNGDNCVVISTINNISNKDVKKTHFQCETAANLNIDLGENVTSLNIELPGVGYQASVWSLPNFVGFWVDVYDYKSYFNTTSGLFNRYIKSIKLELKVAKNCIRLFSACDFLGHYVDYCTDQSIIKPFINQIGSYYAGLECKGILFESLGFGGKFLHFNEGENMKCLQGVDMSGASPFNNLRSLKMNTHNCLIITITETNGGSYNKFYCQDTPSADAWFNQLVTTQVKFHLAKSKSKAILYDQENYQGNEWTVEQSTFNAIKKPPIEYVKSVKFVDVK